MREISDRKISSIARGGESLPRTNAVKSRALRKCDQFVYANLIFRKLMIFAKRIR